MLILPLIIHMVWSNRGHLRDLVPEPSPWGPAIIALFGGVWGLAFAAGIAEVAQFAVVGVIQGLLLTIFGSRVYRRLWLPFTFLWLLVPTGEFLLPFLQSATAIGSAFLLELSGILTYRDDLTILVPSGSYLVAPGCSGFSFLMSALVVSVTFADTFFRSRTKKIAFVLSALVLSVAANAVRVFLIIAIAHVTDNIGDIADDHLFYGWAFFSLLLLGALAVGYRFRDVVPTQPPGGPGGDGLQVPLARLGWCLGLALVAVAVPLTARVALSDNGTTQVVAPMLSCGTFPVSARKPPWLTAPALANVDAMSAIDCDVGGHTVHLALAVLERPVRRGKLVGVERRIIDHDAWRRLDVVRSSTLIDGRQEPVQAELIGRGATRYLAWSLFWTGGAWRAAGVDAVWADVSSDLMGHRRAVAIVAATNVVASSGAGADDSADSREATAALRDLLTGLPLRELANGGPQLVPY